MNHEDVLRNEIGRYFSLKENSVGPLKIYLGNKVSKTELKNGADAWSFSSPQYVKNTVKNVSDHLQRKGKTFPKKASPPLSPDYCPEIDVTTELDPAIASYYQSLI